MERLAAAGCEINFYRLYMNYVRYEVHEVAVFVSLLLLLPNLAEP